MTTDATPNVPPTPPAGPPPGAPLPPYPGTPHPGMPPYAVPRPPSRVGCIVAVAVALLIGCLLFGGMVMLTGVIGSSLQGRQTALVEQPLDSNFTVTDKILRIQVHGAIMGEGGSGLPFASGAIGAPSIHKYLENARQDPSVKGILLDVDSPGGSVTECEYIVHEFETFRADLKKIGRTVPVVALFGDMAASGGYYISAKADWIIAGRTTTTGSIGVIMSFLNFAGLAKEHGVTEVVIKSGKMKNLLSRFQPPGPEESAVLEALVKEMHGRFLEVISEGRLGKGGLTREKLEELADGRVYSATQAKDLGLVDSIGFVEDAIAKLKELAAIPDARLVEYKKVGGLADLFQSSALFAPPRSAVDDVERAIRLEAPRMMYLWNGR